MEANAHSYPVTDSIADESTLQHLKKIAITAADEKVRLLRKRLLDDKLQVTCRSDIV